EPVRPSIQSISNHEKPMNLKKYLSNKILNQKPGTQEYRVQCTACNGTSRIVTGIKAICIEMVEKTEKCPECNGKGIL
ncbi:MAG: hypothetical protein MUO26_08430, partial [Methanotrichaceae archaeon]|nr:hypothetical protein [Methanotrichaceae archaeon]